MNHPNAFVTDGALICTDCAERLHLNTDGMPAHFGIEEADSPQSCDVCLGFIDSSLTPDGEEYVRGKALAGIPAEWRERWSYLFD